MKKLEVSDLHKQFKTRNGPVVALKNINFQMEEGEFVSLIGASGCGKSTLLRLVAGLDRPTAGHISIEGDLVIGPGPDRCMVFQSYTLYPWMNVKDNVGFGLKLQKVSQGERRERVDHFLEVVGLTDFAHALPKELSGGMKQRVAIARALASEPKVLLMDEPFGALDAQTKEMMQELLIKVWKRTGATILMITHDVEEAVFLSQRIYVLTSQPGQIKHELEVDLPSERTHVMKRKPDFREQKNFLLDLLRNSGRVAVTAE